MRLVPQSLFGRLVLVLLGGLAIAQAATLYINLAERDQLLYRAGGMRLAQQISDIVKLLDSLPAAERRRVVAVFNAPPLVVSLDRRPVEPVQADESADFRHAMFTTMLRYALGENARVAVARAPDSPRALERREPPFMPMMQHPMRGRGPGPGFIAGGPLFVVQVALGDGTLVTFDTQVSAQEAALPLRVALTLFVLLGTVVVLSLVAVRWVTKPLATLANAAQQLGVDIHRAPLAESGPAEAQRAARAFNTMQRRLQSFITDRARILAAMSHDLKTPITRLRLRAEALGDDALRRKFEHDLDEMQAMVTQTLEFMRDTSAAEPPQRVDLMALIESVRDDYADTGKTVALEGRIERPYAGRPLALRRCLGNLLDNAIRYGERATLRVEDHAREVVIRVLDEGPGMAEADLEKAFEPFFRGEASRSRETGGTGLGLGIARNIARAHGGDLVLKNRLGKGLEAILTLSRSEAA
jgi:signal transduction histidine kinase